MEIGKIVTVPDYDSDESEDIEVEDTIFHPSVKSLLKKEKLVNKQNGITFEDRKDSGIEVNKGEGERLENVKLAPDQFAEIELDHALMQSIDTDDIITNSETSGSLADSGGSGSSVLVKLQTTAADIKEEQLNDTQSQIDTCIATKTLAECKNAPTNQHHPTITIDLRNDDVNGEIPYDPAVFARYHSSQFDDAEEDDVIALREELKRKSHEIIAAKKSAETTATTGRRNGEDPYSIDNLVNHNTSNLLVQHVDEMLANVDKIRYEAAAEVDTEQCSDFLRKNGDEIPYYDDTQDYDDVAEVVKQHVVFANNGGDFNISQNGQIMPPENFVDNDMKSELVDWSTLHPFVEKSANQESPRNKVDCFDALFKNSFIAQSLSKVGNTATEVNTKPKRNILGTSKKKMQQPLVFVSPPKKFTTVQELEAMHLKERQEAAAKKKLEAALLLNRKLSTGECNACVVGSQPSETPLKHDAQNCTLKKSTGCNTDDLKTFIANNNNSAAPNLQEMISTAKSKEEVTNGTQVENGEAVPATTTTTAGKKKNKKKKKKTNKTLSQDGEEHKDENQSQQPVISEAKKKKHKGMEELAENINSLSVDNLLFDEHESFSEPYVNLPPSEKQQLLLKIPLESPGVIKTMDPSVVDDSLNDNYIGLLTFMLLLLQGSKWELPNNIKEIPFDVVSLQQSYLEGELFILVSIVENENTHQHKVKRSKLGSSFFHAVSQFLNATFLDQMLKKIWSVVEIGKLKSVTDIAGTIWQQVEQRNLEQCEIPLAVGKLSLFINIIPDASALHRLFSIPAAITPNEMQKNHASAENLHYEGDIPKQNLTCITIYNVAAMSPKQLSAFFRRFRDESIEIVGLRLAYPPKSTSTKLAELAICINEVNSTNIQEGRLLLTDSEKDFAISFQCLGPEKMAQTAGKEPLINYTVNASQARRKVVQWFGPHFKDASEANDAVSQLQTSAKKKWNFDTVTVSLLTSCVSESCLLFSSEVPSSFIVYIICLAAKRGLELKSITRHLIPPEEQRAFGIVNNNKNNANYASKHFTLLVFQGSSANFRLLGLKRRLHSISQRPITGESLSQLCHKDNVIKFSKSHNKNENFVHFPTRTLFHVLNFNDQIVELLSSATHIPKNIATTDVRTLITRARLNNYTPELNFLALVTFGNHLVSNIPALLAQVLGLSAFSCINAWRRASQTSASALEYVPTIQLLAIKNIDRLTQMQARDFCLAEPLTDTWLTECSSMVGECCTVVLLRCVDKRHAMDVREAVNEFALKQQCADKVVIHADVEYVATLMFKYFNMDEVFGDRYGPFSQSLFLPTDHDIFQRVAALCQSAPSTFAAVQKIPTSDVLSFDSDTVQSEVYHVKVLPFPMQLMLINEPSYTGMSILYKSQNMVSITKAVGRIVHMGFQICAIRYPVLESGSHWIRIVLKRPDAIYLLNKLVNELQKAYQSLVVQVSENSNEVLRFIENNFKPEKRSGGGIFYSNYFSLINKMHYDKKIEFGGSNTKEIFSDPESDSYSRYDYMKAATLSTPCMKTDEMTVLILTTPIVTGTYNGKQVSRKCKFAALWHLFETVSYRALAIKMGLCTEQLAQKIVNQFSYEDAMHSKRMVKLLSNDREPFIAVVLLGSCILSNFTLTMERNVGDADAVKTVQDYCIIPSTKAQAEFLLLSLFDRVIPNTKFDIRVCV